MHTDVDRAIQEKTLFGEAAFAELVSQFTQKFTNFSVTHVPVLLAQYAVREGTPLKEWYSEFRELCGGLQCFGEYCPSDTQILHAATASLNRQYPEIAFGLAPLITGCTHVDEMWSLFDVNKLGANTSPAKRSGETPVTLSQQPRVHAVSSTGQYDVTDSNASAYELVSDDEGYQMVQGRARAGSSLVFPVARSTLLKFWKYPRGSDKGEALKQQLGRVCFNCGRDDHFLWSCPEPFMNACKMFDERFGEGSADEVDARWKAKLRGLQNQRDTDRKQSSSSAPPS